MITITVSANSHPLPLLTPMTMTRMSGWRYPKCISGVHFDIAETYEPLETLMQDIRASKCFIGWFEKVCAYIMNGSNLFKSPSTSYNSMSFSMFMHLVLTYDSAPQKLRIYAHVLVFLCDFSNPDDDSHTGWVNTIRNRIIYSCFFLFFSSSNLSQHTHRYYAREARTFEPGRNT